MQMQAFSTWCKCKPQFCDANANFKCNANYLKDANTYFNVVQMLLKMQNLNVM